MEGGQEREGEREEGGGEGATRAEIMVKQSSPPPGSPLSMPEGLIR
jgi:hypothetical protein